MQYRDRAFTLVSCVKGAGHEISFKGFALVGVSLQPMPLSPGVLRQGKRDPTVARVAMAPGTTVFPRNLAAVGFYFKALFGAATIRGRRLQRSTRTRVHSFNNKPI